MSARFGNKSWIRVAFHGAPGNWCETTTKTQQHIPKSGDKMTLSWSIRKLVRSVESAISGFGRKLVRGDDIQIDRTTMEFHNLQISAH